MNGPQSLILQAAVRFLLPLQLLFSLFMLFRGHNQPGGGFIAGLVTSGAIALYLFAFDVERTRELVRVEPQVLWGVGLLFCASSTLVSVFLGYPLMTSIWWEPKLPVLGTVSLSTPLVFDTGVYLAVVGTVFAIVRGLAEEGD